jgi:RNA polymerase sigma-70 factor (ECF subfamily)
VADPSLKTAQLQGWLERMRAGDPSAREELLRRTCGRLERLAHKMLRRFPGVRRWADTDDVLQSALMRLLRSLEKIRPASTREFFGLAAEQIRRELLDLARHFYGPEGPGAHHASRGPDGDTQLPSDDPPDRRDDPEDLELWCAFHQEVEKLPVAEREVVGLIYYHGWRQAEVGELLHMAPRTVRRHWEAALKQLHRALNAGSSGS